MSMHMAIHASIRTSIDVSMHTSTHTSIRNSMHMSGHTFMNMAYTCRHGCLHIRINDPQADMWDICEFRGVSRRVHSYVVWPKVEVCADMYSDVCTFQHVASASMTMRTLICVSARATPCCNTPCLTRHATPHCTVPFTPRHTTDTLPTHHRHTHDTPTTHQPHTHPSCRLRPKNSTHTEVWADHPHGGFLVVTGTQVECRLSTFFENDHHAFDVLFLASSPRRLCNFALVVDVESTYRYLKPLSKPARGSAIL